MMGYKESIAQELSLGDPIFQRIHNLRPLIPNSYLSPPNHNHLIHHHHDFGTNKGVVEDCNKEGNAQQVMVSSRWNPTPEQLTALEELYRCGTRTPSAEQIQHITAQLRRYGKIEGKNVFYWFQNHKARERQKRRRQLQPHVTATNTTSHANHVTDKGFEEEEEEKNGKRALFIINNNKESDSEAPILQESATATTAAGPRKSDNSSNSLQCLFQFHQQSSAQQFQHNYNPNNSSYPTTTTTKHLFLSDQGNATWSSPHHFTIIPPSLNLFSLNSTAVVENSGRGDGVVVPTLQLFPVVKPSDDGDNGDLKKDGEVVSCLSSSKEEKITNDFVPYYQFL
ncbi:uncharacterized protein LOC141610795 isoform X2 [Silene latifolia]|uniref:uncharacterized protein LOC141610795 isoform X2 n=1 Tax=Silene latifolia TaxID=37657 RepID=UPI003D780D13